MSDDKQRHTTGNQQGRVEFKKSLGPRQPTLAIPNTLKPDAGPGPRQPVKLPTGTNKK